MPRFSRSLLPSGSPTNALYAFQFSPTSATYPAHLTFRKLGESTNHVSPHHVIFSKNKSVSARTVNLRYDLGCDGLSSFPGRITVLSPQCLPGYHRKFTAIGFLQHSLILIFPGVCRVGQNNGQFTMVTACCHGLKRVFASTRHRAMNTGHVQ
jgi:hypothetical protein